MQKCCWILLIFILVGSCLDNDICLRGADNALIIGFVKLADGKPDTVILYNVAATGSDSVFYQDFGTDLRDTLAQRAEITVNPYATETTFTFKMADESLKELQVGYNSEVRFVSEECGSERLQYNLKVLYTDFDSVRVVRSSLNKGKSINIEIYN